MSEDATAQVRVELTLNVARQAEIGGPRSRHSRRIALAFHNNGTLSAAELGTVDAVAPPGARADARAA